MKTLLLRKFYRVIRKYLRRHGFILRKVNMIDRRHICNDPRQFLYLGGSRVIINVPLERGRRKIFPVKAEYDPFYCALSLCLHSGNDREKLREVLKVYYSMVQPKNALEWLGLEYEDAPALANARPWAAPPPWTDLTVKEVDRNVNNDMLHDSGHGDKKLSVDQGWAHCGPVSDEKIRLEVDRLYVALDSIQRLGYDRNYGPGGDIGAKFLFNEEGDWCWTISPGNHRIAIVSALGYEEIPVMAKSIVFRRDVDVWPNVLSGLYTRTGALKYFDNLFVGKESTIMKPWVEYVNTVFVREGKKQV